MSRWQRQAVILTAALHLLMNSQLVSGARRGKTINIWMPMLQHVLVKCSVEAPLYKEAILQLKTCAFGPLNHCLSHEIVTTKGLTSPLSKFCGWIIIGGGRIKNLSIPKLTKLKVLSNAGVNLTFTHFDVPWRGPRCPSIGVKVFKPPGKVLGVFCGRRMPWSLAVPDSQFTIRVFGHPSDRAFIRVAAFYEVIPVNIHIPQDEPSIFLRERPLKYLDPQTPDVRVLPSMQSTKPNLRNTWHILTFPIKFLQFKIRAPRVSQGKVVIYDGPGSRSPTLFTQENHSSVLETTGFHATVIVILTSVGAFQQANVLYRSASHFLKSEMSPSNPCPTWFWFQREGKIDISASASPTENTICMTRFMALDSNDKHDLTVGSHRIPTSGSIELRTTTFTFIGPSTYDNNIDSECQYGGVFVYYGDVRTHTSSPLKWLHFCEQEGTALPEVLVLDSMVLVAVWFNGYSSGRLQATLRPSRNCDSYTAVKRDAPVRVFLGNWVCSFIFAQFHCDIARKQEDCIIIIKSPIYLTGPLGPVEIKLINPVLSPRPHDNSKNDALHLFSVVWFTEGDETSRQMLNSGGYHITGPKNLKDLGLMVAANASSLWNAASFKISRLSAPYSIYDTEGKDTKISLDNNWDFFAMMPSTQHTISIELKPQRKFDTQVLFTYRYGCPLLCRNDTFTITERHNNTVSVVFTWTGQNSQLELLSFHKEHISSIVNVRREPIEECAQLQPLCAAQITLWFGLSPARDKTVTDDHYGQYTLHHPPSRGLTWIDAERNCVMKGGHLQSILEQMNVNQEMAAIGMLKNSHPFMDILLYIGLNDRKMASHYEWTDGSAVPVQYWARPDNLPTKAEYFIRVGQDQIHASGDDLLLDQSQKDMQLYINKLLQKHQPTTDEDERCSAMVINARGDIIGWVKLPCSKSLQANYICFVPWSNVTKPFEDYGLALISPRKSTALSAFHFDAGRSEGKPHLAHPNKACPEKWFSFGATCYTLATVRKQVYARDMEATCRKLGGRPMEVLDKRELAEDLGKQIYYCVERSDPSVCNSQSYLGLTAGEYRWARGTVDYLTSQKFLLTSFWAVKAKILQQGVPISLRDVEKVTLNGTVVSGLWRRKRVYYHGYSDYYDLNDWTYSRYAGLDYDPDLVSFHQSEEFFDLKDFLAYVSKFLPVNFSHDGVRLLSFAVKTLRKGQGLLFQDHASDTWLYSEYKPKEPIPATYIMCQAEPLVHEEACKLPQRQCRDGSCVLQTRFCDKRVDCADGSDEDSCESSSICTQADTFLCLSGDCIPLHLLCDGRPDCADNSDETYCKEPASCSSDQFVCEDGYSIPNDAVCDGIEHCKDKGDEMNCSYACKGFPCHDGRCIFWSKVNDGFPDCAFGEDEAKQLMTMGINTAGELRCYGQHLSRAQLSCHSRRPSGPPPCFDIGEICILKKPHVCPNGGNIMNCRELDCPGMFKCGLTSTYCIPVFKVCDGHMDCPYQADERDCDSIVCPGLLKCAQEEVCVPQANICDGLSQCTLSNDDEVGCFPCPEHCECNAYTITCNLHGSEVISAKAVFVKFLVLQNVPTVFAFEAVGHLIPDLVYLKLLKGTFQAFSGLRQNLPLQVLIISRTELRKVSRSLLQGMPSLQFLDLSNNRISTIVERTFTGLQQLKVLNLANNLIRILLSKTFSTLLGLEYLNLNHNRVLYIEPGVFDKLDALQYLKTTVPRINCFAPLNLGYSGKGSSRPSFCSQHLFERRSQKVFAWLFGLTGLLCNTVVAYLACSQKSEKKKQEGKRAESQKQDNVYTTLVVNTVVADGLMSFYVTCLAIVDLYFRKQFSAYIDTWKVHVGCKLLGFLSLFSLEASLLTTLLIATVRLLAVVYPIRFYQAAGKQRLASFACLVVSSIAAVFAFLPLVPLKQTIGNVSPMANAACMLLPFDGETSEEASSFWCALLAVNGVAVMLIAGCYSKTYFHVFRSRVKRKKELLTSDQKTPSQMLPFVLNVIKTLLADCLAWVPPIAFMCISLTSDTLSDHMEMWVAIAVLPFRATFSPLLSIIGHILLTRVQRH